MKNIIFIAALATSIVFASCNSNKTETHGEETEHHDEHENTNTAMLTAEQMKSIKIELGSIEKKQLTASLKANGLLKVPNQNKAKSYFTGSLASSWRKAASSSARAFPSFCFRVIKPSFLETLAV